MPKTPRRYPFDLDADTLVGLVSTCWRGHDGQWFLKAAGQLGLETAMRLNEAAIASLARIELREFKRVTGIEVLETMAEIAEWYRLSQHIFSGFGRPSLALTVLDGDTLVVENERCFGEAIAERSGYAHLSPGSYPPCLGWLGRQRAWGEAFSPQCLFTVAREPVDGRPCRYVVRRTLAAPPAAGCR